MSTSVVLPPRTATARPAWRWVHVGVAAAAMVATLPGRTHGLGIITEPVMRDLELDRVAYATLNFWATLIGAVFCVPIGWLLDRLGIRVVLAGVTGALGGVVLLMSSLTAGGSVGMPLPAIEPSNSTWFGLPSVPLNLFILVALTRGLGQGALSVISLALLGKAAGRKPGLAVGVYSFVMALGFIGAFLGIKEVFEAPENVAVAQFKQDEAAGAAWGAEQDYRLRARAEHPGQWRQVWGGIGWALIGTAVILPWFVRRLPEEREETPQGEIERPSYTLGQALFTPGFWVFGLATSFYGLLSSGLMLFNQSVLDERGFDRTVFLTITAISPIFGLSSNLLAGVLARFGVRLGYIMATSMFIQGLSLVLFPYVSEMWHVYAYAVAMGVSGGAMTVVFFAYWTQAYGPKHLGRIQGVAQMLTVLASAAGPLVLAAGQRAFDSYAPIIQQLSVVSFLFALATAIVPMPKQLPPSKVTP